MRLKWLPHVGGVWSAVGDHGTWIIVNTNMAGKPNWWLCVHPWDSNDFEERGNFPNREAAQAHAQHREDWVPIQAQGVRNEQNDSGSPRRADRRLKAR